MPSKTHGENEDSSSNVAGVAPSWENPIISDGPGFKYFSGWIAPERASAVFTQLNSNEFPWNTKPRLYGERLPQHAYSYKRGGRNKVKNAPPLQLLEDLCQKISSEFQCEVYTVVCNRFQDPQHHIPWHQDKYASHILVLSLGCHRTLEFRCNKTRDIQQYCAQSGDLYFMSLQHNKDHHHRVKSALESIPPVGDETETKTRISLVFFISAPFGLDKSKDYKISRKDMVVGMWNELME